MELMIMYQTGSGQFNMTTMWSQMVIRYTHVEVQDSDEITTAHEYIVILKAVGVTAFSL